MKSLSLAAILCALSAPAFANCYQGPFEAFFKDFSSDISIQEAVMAERIHLQEHDFEVQPEPELVAKVVAREDFLLPLVPALKPFERSGGSVQYEIRPEGHAAKLSGDSGYLMTLIFTQDPCWTLVSIIDQSM